MIKLSKRNFLKGGAAAAAAALCGAEAQARPAQLPKSWDITTDVVVLGYGGAGACAAITAKDAGAQVMIFEKMEQGGGNTAVSSGGMMIPNDADKAISYLLKTFDFANSEKDEKQVRAFVAEAMKSKDFLLSLRPEQKLYIYGHAGFQNIPGAEAIDKWRFRTPKGSKLRGGDVLFSNYRYAVEEVRKIPVTYKARALELIQENGEVLGAVIEINGQKKTVRAKRAVILATGGFEFDDVMLSNYTMGQKFHRLGSPGNTGDGIRMAQAAGADLWHMNALSCPLGVQVPGLKTALQFGMLAPSYIFVDQDGRRFVNEKFDNHTGVYAVNVLDAVKHRYPRIPCYAVFDEAARREGTVVGGATSGFAINREGYRWSRDNSVEIEKGIVKKASTLEELAKVIGVPAENLAATVKRWNEQITAGADKDFGRPIKKKGKAVFEGRDAPILARPLGDGPYYAVALYPSLLNTQGGPRRNGLGQVLNPFKRPIPRLYSAGELGSMWGHIYQGATNNSEACVFGRIAGRTAAAEKPWC
ncbi:FAD-binding protein [Mesosutterella sp. AGMB02718]|uniref:FAD-binding protein n=1 Tax=Mesosutterella faecium TaxID=2925194 RepID=A0ABT7IP61_9BURK|nr:FAD-binding protein [Mesosutterella sp. AGMB02718]MDL2060169.1 FAD-binding protein [Mesosutterella sp. AGMB02718]